MFEMPPVPPFRNEQRWGNRDTATFTDLDLLVDTEQLISVNEVPARAWDLLLVLEPAAANFHSGSLMTVVFEIFVGVGSTVSTFKRILRYGNGAPDPNAAFTGAIEALVLPAASFIVKSQLSLAPDSGSQTFPYRAACGVYAAPRGMPFLASLESQAFMAEG